MPELCLSEQIYEAQNRRSKFRLTPGQAQAKIQQLIVQPRWII